MDFDPGCPLMDSFGALIWESLEERWGPLESVAEVQLCLKIIIIIFYLKFQGHHKTTIIAMITMITSMVLPGLLHQLGVVEEQDGTTRKLLCTHQT